MEELLVSLKGKPKRRKINVSSFTAAKRQKFLDGLALTCNISRSASYAGVHRTTICATRQRDPVFAEQFRQALALGYDRIEALVLEHGGAGVDIDIDPDRAEADGLDEPFDMDRAIRVLTYRRGERNGEAHGTPPPGRHARGKQCGVDQGADGGAAAGGEAP